MTATFHHLLEEIYANINKIAMCITTLITTASRLKCLCQFYIVEIGNEMWRVTVTGRVLSPWTDVFILNYINGTYDYLRMQVNLCVCVLIIFIFYVFQSFGCVHASSSSLGRTNRHQNLHVHFHRLPSDTRGAKINT